MPINNFSLSVATVNGSGSQSANQIIAKSLFRMGLPVGAKNLFPSNIAGLPTWFTIRVSANGFCGRKIQHDIVVAKNSESFASDLQSCQPGGLFFYDADIKSDGKRDDIIMLPIPFRALGQNLSDSVKMRKLLSNMIYVGILIETLNIDKAIVHSVVDDLFAHKENVVKLNENAIEVGALYAREHLSNAKGIHSVNAQPQGNTNKILIDGNAAAALGAIDAGCTVVTWYPITPSSSLAESFHEFAKEMRIDATGKNQYAILQAEDELSAINMVIGAGWAGSRAMTATSGPGLSLMAEAAGLAYFAEIPAVIWDVQRAGPSTGLPTRTMQGDLKFAVHLSHGDTEHIVLLPANPKECFEFARIAFDLAEKIQTLVIVLSDLDLGMNISICDEFKQNTQDYQRGKVLTAEELNNIENFARYRDVDGDGIGYRTLPGTMHVNAAYFTRGTAHNEASGYSEDPVNFKNLLDRLKHKFNLAKTLLPQPLLMRSNKAQTQHLIVAYGSSDFVIPELQHELLKRNVNTDYLRIRAMPLADNLLDTLSSYQKIYVIEQNRDAQLFNILKQNFSSVAMHMKSIRSYDGLPLAVENILPQFFDNDKESSHRSDNNSKVTTP